MTCEIGDKPIVKYKFGTGELRNFKTEISPIDVRTKEVPIPATGDYKEDGLAFRLTVYNYSSPTIDFVVRDYKVVEIRPEQPFYGGSNRYIYIQDCNSDEIDENTAYAVDMSTFQPLDGIKCENAKNKRCSIQVFDLGGSVIFQDQGDCPCSYEVQCGNCPSGNIECKKAAYPGYCCIPCQELANKIHNLANKIK